VVLVQSTSIGLDESFERWNPVAERRAAEAAAEQEAAEAAAEVERQSTEDAQAHAEAVQDEAGLLNKEMRSMEASLNRVLDEHNKVYGDDGWASFNDIARKYKSYTSEALDGLNADLEVLTFRTEEVNELNSDWHDWWGRFFALESRSETAARNDDSESMDAVRVDQDQLWDDWSELFDQAAELMGG
jgi:chloramphenicol 3-O-phosphotransferase